MSFIVICRDNGDYVLATRRQFDTHTEALVYAASIAQSRDPIALDLGGSYGITQTRWPKLPEPTEAELQKPLSEPCAVLTSWQHESAITTAANESRPWTDTATATTRNEGNLPVLETLRALTDWAREHTSPLDADSPHDLLIRAVAVIEEADKAKANAKPNCDDCGHGCEEHGDGSDHDGPCHHDGCICNRYTQPFVPGD